MSKTNKSIKNQVAKNFIDIAKTDTVILVTRRLVSLRCYNNSTSSLTKARSIIRSLRDVVVYRFGWLTKYMKSNVCRLNVQESYSGCEENPESKQRVLSRFFRVSSRDQARRFTRAFSVVALRWPRFACEKYGSGENMFTAYRAEDPSICSIVAFG